MSIIKTARLMLRALEINDLDTTYEYASDAKNTEYMIHLPDSTKEETEQFLQRVSNEWRKELPRFYEFAVILNGKHIGAASISIDEDREEGELGWIIHKDYQGKGYATEAAKAVMDMGLKELGLKKIVACCDYRNTPSCRVMQKIGLSLERDDGVRRYKNSNEEFREFLYSLTANAKDETMPDGSNKKRSIKRVVLLGAAIILCVLLAVALRSFFVFPERVAEGQLSDDGVAYNAVPAERSAQMLWMRNRSGEGASGRRSHSREAYVTFEEAVERLKVKAQSGRSYGNVKEVGAGLIKLLSSFEARLITDTTFAEEYLTVSITDNRLTNGAVVREVRYMMRSGETIPPYEEEIVAFFLQYIPDNEMDGFKYETSNRRDFDNDDVDNENSNSENSNIEVFDRRAFDSDGSNGEGFFSEVEIVRELNGSIDHTVNAGPLRIFGNDEGDIYCFVMTAYPGQQDNDFLLSETTWGDRQALKSYRALLWYTKDDHFVKEEIDIPFRVREGESVDLRVPLFEDEMVSYIEDGEAGTYEPVFNTDTNTFNIISKERQSRITNDTFPALLLGLSDTKGNLRTLYIRMEGARITCTEYPGEIIIPRGQTNGASDSGGLFSVRGYEFHEEVESEWQDEETGEVWHATDIRVDVRKLLLASLGVDRSGDIEEQFLPLPEWGFYELTEIPLYIDSEYICYLRQRYYSGGGTFHFYDSAVGFERLDGLDDFTADYSAEAQFFQSGDTINRLAERLFGGQAKSAMAEEGNDANYRYGGEPQFNFNQLAIRRNLGKWCLMLPIQRYYEHSGNGSVTSSIEDFVLYSNELPDFRGSPSDPVDPNETLLGWKYLYNWDQKDYLTFPQGEAYLSQFDHIIKIESASDDDPDHITDLSIPVKIYEFIVSATFANEGEQAEWDAGLAAIAP
ncbi:MAG: GNAT family N-acetyltransferase [Lachnospiraceae bacterium]|jgi:RimJ/RimL family protein N-acetyltransferase|nr:GNAT family N-acetyltransferase [Lachnospiraceae bacterium]